MEQLCIPLPPYALRAGARETIYFNPLESKIASEQSVCVGMGGACCLCFPLLGLSCHCSLPPPSLHAPALCARACRLRNPAPASCRPLLVLAVVTCGGLCPGLNDVVQGIVKKASDYGVPDGNILGIRYGFKGFYDKKAKPVVLTPQSVDGIHLDGGTVLGTSRGGAQIK